MQTDIRVVELFAGVGGFRLGLERASDSFKTVWANQWEPGKTVQWAFDCYEKHFGKNPNYSNEDIGTVIDKVPEHDLLVGGFPCQDYSVARTGAKGIEGKKGVLWWSINSILELRHPKYVLLENVDRLLKSPASQRGRDFAIILRCFMEAGYMVEWRVVNAADYGNAQRRRRTFIFAYREGDSLFEAGRECRTPDDLKDWIRCRGFFARTFPIASEVREMVTSVSQSDYADLEKVSKNFRAELNNAGVMSTDGQVVSLEVIPKFETPRTLNDICVKTDVPDKYLISEDKIAKWKFLKGPKRIKRIRPNGVPYFFSEGGIPYPDFMDRPSRTMLTSESTLNRSTHLITDAQSGKLRILLPVECERLDGFDDGWTEGMPERMRYFTMGNALVVPLITRMGKTLLSVMGKTLKPPVHHALEPEYQPLEQSYLTLAEKGKDLYVVSPKPVTLCGTYRQACREWIEANRLYNYPLAPGILEKRPELLAAKVIILGNRRDRRPVLRFRVIGTRQVTTADLAKLGYPVRKGVPKGKAYLLYKLAPFPAKAED